MAAVAAVLWFHSGMATTRRPLGVKYPERAEGLRMYADYKVFVEFWAPLVKEVAEFYRRLAVRRETRVLGIYGPQGAGKTLFGDQLIGDFNSTKDAIASGELRYDDQNVWHLITGDKGRDTALVAAATSEAGIREVANSTEWADKLAQWLESQENPTIAIADNAETHYFLNGLMPRGAELGSRHDEQVLRAAAERLVQRARTDLSGVLLILLSNDLDYLRSLQATVERQHHGLMSIVEIPLPSATEKEKAVRVNVNRLNEFTYWYCLDRGGLPQKKSVRALLSDATTFPRAFEAVDEALRSSDERTGRPPRKNLLTLVAFADREDFTPEDLAFSDSVEIEAHAGWALSLLHDVDWAGLDGITARHAALLESEWQLRVVMLGNPFVARLLTSDSRDGTLLGDLEKNDGPMCRKLLETIQAPLGPTSTLLARKAYRAQFQESVEAWQSRPEDQALLDDFWGRGQARSLMYEARLGDLLGHYDRASPGLLDARPDYVVQDYVPCSILSAPSASQAALNAAIRRNAHLIEFTAQRNPSVETLRGYLATKLPNYIRATQDQ